MEDIIEIEFQGVKIKKSGEYWKCPFKCHKDKRFPAPKWKTLKGFEKHLNSCPNSPSNIKIKEEKERLEEELKKKWIQKLNEFKDSIINSISYKIGDECYIIDKIVLKDVYEWARTRWVKVRHEPILHFKPLKIKIEKIDFCEPKQEPTDENLISFLLINDKYKINELIKSEEEAKKEADEKNRIYKQHLENSSLLR